MINIPRFTTPAQVDLFVNYDCDLQAANLFERLVRGLSKVVQQAPNPNAPLGGPGSAPQGAAGAVLASHLKPRDAAMGALLALIASLDVWAAPLQARSASTPMSLNPQPYHQTRAASSRPPRSCTCHQQLCPSPSSSCPLDVWHACFQPSSPFQTSGLPLCRHALQRLGWFAGLCSPSFEVESDPPKTRAGLKGERHRPSMTQKSREARTAAAGVGFRV